MIDFDVEIENFQVYHLIHCCNIPTNTMSKIINPSLLNLNYHLIKKIITEVIKNLLCFRVSQTNQILRWSNKIVIVENSNEESDLGQLTSHRQKSDVEVNRLNHIQKVILLPGIQWVAVC